MKKLLLAAVLGTSMNAFAAQYVTVEVCNGGESGQECRMVTYRVREASAPVVEACTVAHGEAGTKPCPTVTGVPGWLKRLNEAFAKAGFKAPETTEAEMNGGPN
ncbi:MAG TPA: hypothetical protein PLZ57_15015 [Pseudobdellovibrionaceae bacterium]|nr:hypothetical protein [Pseudobdellovibrionaceae bacterium]